MSSYEELYNMIMEESVKGEVGRAGLKAINTSKNLVKDTKTAVSGVKDKVKSGYDKVKNNKIVGPAVTGTKKAVQTAAGVMTYPITKSADVIANKMVKSKENKIKKEFAGNPEKMETELKKNVNRLSELKTDIMALEVWTIGWPAAIATLGTMDNVLKGIIAAGGVARNDKELVSAVAKAAVWAPVAAAKLSKIMGKEIDGGKALAVVKDITKKITSTLETWAESDQGLLKEDKTPTPVTESVTLERPLYAIICESLVNDEIDYDEASYLIESVYGYIEF